MDLNINIKVNSNCSITVQDTTEYLSEDFTGIVANKFKYSDTISIDVLYYNKLQTPYYSNLTYNNHTDSSTQTKISVDQDGWFTVIHIVLPSKEWFEKELKKEASTLGLYTIVYYSDGSNIYKYIDGESSKVDIKEVIEINNLNTPINRTQKDFVSICFLKKCYINLCQQIFSDRGFSKCLQKNTIDNELVYKRDLLWMSLNVIKYLTENEQLYEVERIIETIQGCNGLCSSQNNSNQVSSCGCSQ